MLSAMAVSLKLLILFTTPHQSPVKIEPLRRKRLRSAALGKAPQFSLPSATAATAIDPHSL